MIIKKSGGKSARKSVLTGKKALVAAKAAKKAYANKAASQPTAWKKGGREWSRVLGHFGPPTTGSSGK
jgi:hypothetical protein